MENKIEIKYTNMPRKSWIDAMLSLCFCPEWESLAPVFTLVLSSGCCMVPSHLLFFLLSSCRLGTQSSAVFMICGLQSAVQLDYSNVFPYVPTCFLWF